MYLFNTDCRHGHLVFAFFQQKTEFRAAYFGRNNKRKDLGAQKESAADAGSGDFFPRNFEICFTQIIAFWQLLFSKIMFSKC